MKKTSSSPSMFYAYRYFEVRNAQTTLIDDEKTMHQLIKRCEAEKQVSLEVENRRDLLLFVHKYNDHTYLFKFCRDFPITKYNYDDEREDIVESIESNYPFIHVIINTIKQIILLEHKTSIYTRISDCKNAFKSFVAAYIHNLNYTFSMDEIINLATFWETVQDAKNIFELRLNLKSPNLFGSALSTSNLLKKLKTDFNNDELDMSFKNANGYLSLSKETVGDAIDYAGGGGGHWKMSLIRKGQTKKTTVNSSKSIKIIEVTDFEDELRLEGNHEIIDKIADIDDIIKD